jgi:urate oxidase
MTVTLAHNNYGKSRVRLLRVTRGENQHDIKDLTFWIQFEGDFEAVHTAGDNRKILTTDTMKNTVYVLAKQYPAEPIEDFSMHLIEHFLTYNPQVSKVRIVAAEKYWNRIPVGGGSHRFAFTSAGNERRMSEIEGVRGSYTIRAGIEDLIVLKTAKSAFVGFLRDPYTTLEDTRDRVLSTNLRAHWLYQGDEIPFSPTWHGVRQVLINTFADHDSQSLQHTLYAMGEAVLKSFDAIREIQFSLPNQHYNLVDLKPFGIENENEIFLPTDEPYGLIEAILKKGN